MTAPVYAAGAPVETVGAGKMFATIAQAIDAALPGAVILVDAGDYYNDFASLTRNVTLIGVGGMVNMIATVPPPNRKGILTISASARIENFSFSGAAVSDADGGNGAGIRYEGGDLVLRNDSFSHNQDGLLAFPVSGLPSNTIVLDHDTFSQNGGGDGHIHNAYIGGVDSLTVTNSVFEMASIGHELKSRAVVNTITNNRFYDGPTATASYDIDLPNGGKDVVTNNTIEKGPNAENNGMVHFGGEGIPYAGSSLLVRGNAFVDDKGSAIGVLNHTAISVNVTGNTFAGVTPDRVEYGPATLTDNWDAAGHRFADGALIGVLPGATQIYTDAAQHTLTLDGANGYQAVQGAGGLLTVTAIIGHIVVIGGSGGLNFSEVAPSGGNVVTTAAGATNTLVVSGQDQLDSEGYDTIKVGAGNINAAIKGDATITDGTGSNYWSVDGTAAIASNNSTEFIGIGAAGRVSVSGTNAFLRLDNNGGSATYDVTFAGVRLAATLNGGAYSMQTYGGASNINTAGGAVGVTMTLTAGDATVKSLGPDVIRAGSGNDVVMVSGAAKVYAGTGRLSVFGVGSSGAKVYGAGGDVTIDGNSGGITYYGGASANSVQSRLSSDFFVGGAGRMTINGGSRETITGGSGGVTFNSNGGGANVVTTIAGSSNTLNLSADDTVDSRGSDMITTTGGLKGAVWGRSTVTAGSGDVDLTLRGRETVTTQGRSVLAVTAGATATINSAGVSDVTETGARVIYTNTGGGNANAVVSGGSAKIHSAPGEAIQITTTGAAPVTAIIGAGAVAVYANAGDKVHAGSGSDYVQIGSDGATVWGGSGKTQINNTVATHGVTVYGGSGALSYDQAGGSLRFIGGSGSASINGAWGSVSVTGGSGHTSLAGGQQATQFVGGSGAADIWLPGGGSVTFGSGATHVDASEWGGANVYTFVGGHAAAQDVIACFRPGTDKLVLKGVSVTSQTLSAGSAGIVFSDGSHLTLGGVSSLDGLFA